MPQYIGYKFNDPICVKKFSIWIRDCSNDSVNAANPPKYFKLQGSNDGTNWEDLGVYANNNTTFKNEVTYEFFSDFS